MSSVITKQTEARVFAFREGVRVEVIKDECWLDIDAATARRLAADLVSAADSAERMQQAAGPQP